MPPRGGETSPPASRCVRWPGADRSPCLELGRDLERDRPRRRHRVREPAGVHPQPADVAPDPPLRRRDRGLPGGRRRVGHRPDREPRALSDQSGRTRPRGSDRAPRKAGEGDAEHPSRLHREPRPAPGDRRAPRPDGRRPACRVLEGLDRGRGDRAHRRGHRRGTGRRAWDLRGAAREHGRRRRHDRADLRPARRGGRGRRRPHAGRASAWTPSTCSPRASRSTSRAGSTGSSTSSTGPSASTGSDASISTTRRPGSGRTATATRTSATD